ncbi:MAG: hypothetical protein SWJ54_11075 [Cyanobacteriota bacterium]|nr:hypothetical protein [Cyanobacteriota bacterium]
MNSLKPASIQESIESYNLTLTEACIMVLAMITALSLQAHAKSQNDQLNREDNLPSSTECKAHEINISNPLRR